MEQEQALKVLAKVKCCWSRQPINEAVAAEWTECLAPVSFQAALEAVRGFRDMGAHDAPTCGEIYLAARGIDDRARAGIRRLPEPERTEAEKEQARRLLRELIERFEGKVDR